MHKLCLILIFLVFNISNLYAQNKNTKYSVGGYIGYCYNLGVRGPKEKTEVSPIKFGYPVATSFGFSFDLKLKPKYFWGLEFAYDEFQAGYSASSSYQRKNTSTGISSGMLLIPERIALIKAGIRIGRSFSVFRGLQFNTFFVPFVAYPKTGNNLTDTSQWNADERTGSYGTNEVQYFRYPAYQNSGLHFVIKATAELQYKFRNNVSVVIDAAYQQGFRPFVIDTVNIVRQYEPNEPKHKYWTRFSGTSVQFHFGVKYDF